MAKTPQSSPERAQLVAAHQQLAAAQEALVQAEAELQQRRRAYDSARGEADSIAARIETLKTTRTHGIDQLIAERSVKLEEAAAAYKAAVQAAYPFGVARKQAEEAVKRAQYPVLNAQQAIVRAATAAASAEAEPVARAALERLNQAFAVILEVGPDVT